MLRLWLVNPQGETLKTWKSEGLGRVDHHCKFKPKFQKFTIYMLYSSCGNWARLAPTSQTSICLFIIWSRIRHQECCRCASCQKYSGLEVIDCKRFMFSHECKMSPANWVWLWSSLLLIEFLQVVSTCCRANTQNGSTPWYAVFGFFLWRDVVNQIEYTKESTSLC